MRAWHNDLEHAIDFVHASPGIDPTSIHCIGFSAGGAVAAKVVSYNKNVASLLLMATPCTFADIIPVDAALLKAHFFSIGTIRDDSFPGDLQKWHNGFLEVKPAHWLPFIHPRPVGIVHGDHDETVPVGHAHELYKAAWEPKKLTILEGATHQLRKDPRINQVIKDWLKEVR